LCVCGRDICLTAIRKLNGPSCGKRERGREDERKKVGGRERDREREQGGESFGRARETRGSKERERRRESVCV